MGSQRGRSQAMKSNTLRASSRSTVAEVIGKRHVETMSAVEQPVRVLYVP